MSKSMKLFLAFVVIALDVVVVILTDTLLISSLETYNPVYLWLFSIFLFIFLPLVFLYLPYRLFRPKANSATQQPVTPLLSGTLTHSHGLPKGVTVKYKNAEHAPVITKDTGRTYVDFGNARVEIGKHYQISIYIYDEDFKATVTTPGFNMISMG